LTFQSNAKQKQSTWFFGTNVAASKQTGLKLSLATENQFITVHAMPKRSQQSRNTVAIPHKLVVCTWGTNHAKTQTAKLPWFFRQITTKSLSSSTLS